MSEFFNSVVIRDGAAIAYEDRHVPGDAFFWILDGPLKAFNNIGYGSHIETEFLCDTAESGYLIDFDGNTLIYFGDPWPTGDKLDEKRAGAIAAFEMGYENFLTHISDCWPSWKLSGTNRGLMHSVVISTNAALQISALGPLQEPNKRNPLRFSNHTLKTADNKGIDRSSNNAARWALKSLGYSNT